MLRLARLYLRAYHYVLKPKFIGGHRVHHGFVGVLLLVHDIRDWKVWFSDFWRSTR